LAPDIDKRLLTKIAIDCRFLLDNPKSAANSGFCQGVESEALNCMVSENSTTRWTAEHVAALNGSVIPQMAKLTAVDVSPAIPHLMLWDMWPVQHFDGSTLVVDGAEVWVIMSAARELHPDQRHDVARLRLALYRDGHWTDCGYLLPDGLNPGAREWAGSTAYDPITGRLILFYTATGRRGETARSFEQRLFQTSGQLMIGDGTVTVTDWSEPFENIVSDDHHYVVACEAEGRPGYIKAFRDPYHFRDPADGQDYILFTASLKASQSEFNGVIGIARAVGGALEHWQLLPPLLSADMLNNEMERPVLRVQNGLYYAFWSTQKRTFAPDGPAGPNGLYGMVAESLFGPYRPLNGSGLIAANPLDEPLQSYSWWVTQTLEVAGFIDHWGLEGRSLEANPDLVISQFGGTPAPRFRIALDGDRAHILLS
jgi:levansucrase